MKLLKIISFFTLVLLFSCQEKTTKKQEFTSAKKNQIEVIDFYGKHRCVACKKIEANAKYTVATYFKNNPKVSFKTINVADDKNKEITERFQAIGTALFLNVIKNGKETHIDLTNFGFKKANNKQEFTTTLQAKINSELKKL